MTLLWICTAAIPAILFIALGAHLYRKRNPLVITASEWLERMRALEAESPSVRPRFLTRYTSKGEPGVSFPEPKKKPGKLVVVKKRTGTRN